MIHALAHGGKPSGRQLPDAGAEVSATSHPAVVAQPPPVQAVVAVGKGVQQAAYPPPRICDHSQEGAVVKVREGSFLGFGLLNPSLECVDPGHGAWDIGKPSRAAHQHGFQHLRAWIGNIIEPAAGPAGDVGADLAQIDRLAAGIRREGFHDLLSVKKVGTRFQRSVANCSFENITEIYHISKNFLSSRK